MINFKLLKKSKKRGKKEKEREKIKTKKIGGMKTLGGKKRNQFFQKVVIGKMKRYLVVKTFSNIKQFLERRTLISCLRRQSHKNNLKGGSEKGVSGKKMRIKGLAYGSPKWLEEIVEEIQLQMSRWTSLIPQKEWLKQRNDQCLRTSFHTNHQFLQKKLSQLQLVKIILNPLNGYPGNKRSFSRKEAKKETQQ